MQQVERHVLAMCRGMNADGNSTRQTRDTGTLCDHVLTLAEPHALRHSYFEHADRSEAADYENSALFESCGCCTHE
jgi:hypothetical protein